MTALGLGKSRAFPFVESQTRNIQDGMRLLEELGAIDSKAKEPKKQLTKMGRQLARLPIDLG